LFINNLPIDGKPPRLSMPFKLSDQQGSKSDYNVQNHLGHVIRPTSPNSTHNNSLYFDSIPRSHSTNNSISSKTYRRPMTPRVGFRTSLFGAIEVRDNKKFKSF
jgi:sodium/potassium/calcium exchanger 6